MHGEIQNMQYHKVHEECSYSLYHRLWYNFGGSASYANKVFIIQKKIIRITTNTLGQQILAGKFSNNMEIMMLYSHYIYSLILYTVNNKNLFKTKNKIHKYKIRYTNNFHLPKANFSKFNKGAYMLGLKFSLLDQYIKAMINDQKCLKSTLKRFYITILSTQQMNIMNIRRMEKCKILQADFWYIILYLFLVFDIGNKIYPLFYCYFIVYRKFANVAAGSFIESGVPQVGEF